ncbi:hypothetical protein CRUP_027123 [Coryphaenoides rupestris]|nr:hypothetical protein CRUP_027123 [Coryphaenoides rupestris]
MISRRERGELARFYTVTEPNKHPKGYTVYKVTARRRLNPRQRLFQLKLSPDRAQRMCRRPVQRERPDVPGRGHRLPGRARQWHGLGPHLPKPATEGATDTSRNSSPLLLPRLSLLCDRQSPTPGPSLPGSLTPNPGQEASRPSSRSLLFPSGLRRAAASASAKEAKHDYLDQAGEHIRQAVQKEAERDYQAAFSYYRSGVDLLLQGVQGEPSPTRREAVKKKTADYLMRAELIASQHLLCDMGQGSTQTVAMVGAQCCPPTSRGRPSPAEELRAYRVLGVIDKVSGKLWSHIGKFLRGSSPDDSFDIPFIQKSHTTAMHSPQRATPPALGFGSGAATGSPPCPGSRPQRGGKHPRPLHLKSAGPPQPDSGATSEEECTNSYLALCNEYEQDKVEPDELEDDEEEQRSGQEASSLSLDIPAATDATASPRSHSLLSNDSLCSSPVGAQEIHFFAEASSGGDGRGRAGEEPEHGEVFSPLPSPAAPCPTLDRSKHTPMEFFRIDSKDSASEVVCPDINGGGGGGGDFLAFPRPLLPSTVDDNDDPQLDSRVTEEDPLELAQEVKGHASEPWWPDRSDDGGSNESVPVISFKEAVVEDEGQPPDLLVNLPVAVVGGAWSAGGGGAASLSEAAVETPGGTRRTGPDVLQLHGEDHLGTPVAHDVGDFLPGTGESHAPDRQPRPNINTDFVRVRPDEAPSAPPVDTDGAVAGRDDPDKEDVSRLFAALDELALEAAHARIPEEFVRCWAVEMVSALDALHQEGVVCRDLNPNNILVDHQVSNMGTKASFMAKGRMKRGAVATTTTMLSTLSCSSSYIVS